MTSGGKRSIGTVWVLAAEAREADAVAATLGRSVCNGFATFLLCSRSGRSLIEDDDLILVSTDRSRSAFQAFVAGHRSTPPAGSIDRSVLLELFARAGSDTTIPGPRETVLLNLAPSGRCTGRKLRGRTAVERALDSLRSRHVIENGYLRERIADEVLKSGVDGTVLGAFLNRLSADALAMRASLEGCVRLAALREAERRYRNAEAAFATLGLRTQAARCVQRRRGASCDVAKALQYSLPGIASASPDMSARETTAGFSSRQCLALALPPRGIVRSARGPSEALVFYHHLGKIVLPTRSVAKLLTSAPDRPDLPFIEASGIRVHGGRVSFDLTVRMQPAMASLLGLRMPRRRNVGDGRQALVLASGRDCSLRGHARPIGADGTARLPMEAGRAGLHRIELIVARRGGSSKHVVTVDLRRPTEFA